jgi:pyruvate/2-oxoglutarate dehydrogenase complex dihydrolipoamide acyltransferase (E2) component
MSQKPQGKVIPMHIGRRLVAEYMHHARKVPSLPLARLTHIPELVAARQLASPTPSWTAIFMRAYALVAREMPELRQAWITFPYARIYEHPSSECAVLIEREVEGGNAVLGTKIRSPETSTLAEIDAHLKHVREAPVWEVSSFRQLLRLGKLPGLLRRWFMWRVLWVSGLRRANRIGTFIISSLGNHGVEQMHPLTSLTTYFTYGPISAEGEVTLKVIYDHRVMDGRTVAKVLVRLEEVLNTTLLQEVRALAQRKAA